MSDVTIVHTKTELEKAIDRRDKRIVIKSRALASDVQTIKSASSGAFALAIGSVGVFATNFWNPLGWGSGIIGTLSTGTLITAIVAIGLSTTLIFAVYNDYSIKGSSSIKLAGGNSIDADLVMERTDHG
ncbi:hypothetical protein [Idiomarina aquatica]|uniref:Uncharacterized protein n=1 Tax=Idiomarina aquatica TaxID=1327752 RepID=A0AA94JCB6_9GAMM|nr:hypothetical protein [Idiomarina aquatica]RUO40302.1 hypothetical protein CWE23_11900 [Idiomarina aquatica]